MWLLSILAAIQLSFATEAPLLFHEYQLINEPWFPSNDALFNATFIGVSPQCKNDTLQWQSDLIHLIEEVALCAVDNSKLCTEKRKHQLLKNSYALKQLDAFGRMPSGILEGKSISYGSPEECSAVSENYIYRTRFCFLRSNIGQECSTPEDDSLYWRTSICMPASCTEEDMTEIIKEMKMYTMGGLLKHCSTVCVHDEAETNTFTWVFTGIMGVIILLCLLGSVTDYVFEHMLRISKYNSETFFNLGIQIITAFSIFTNGYQILDTRLPREGHLKSLDCIRFFSMLWVVSGHILTFYTQNDALFPVLKISQPILSDTIMNAFFSVDSFFVLSGLLVSYMFFKMKTKNPRMVRNPFTWVLFYVHRYLRLTPPYILFIGFYIVVVPLFTGVISTLLQVQFTAEQCRETWWQNLIYINNFDMDNSCYRISWYLACDTQMYIAAPILLIILLISHKLGLIAVFLACVGSTAACMTLIIKYKLPATMAFDISGKSTNIIYVMPWIRCPPYVIGMYTGYFLAKNGNKKLMINKTLILVVWAMAIATALACVYGPYEYLAFKTDWSEFVSAFYYSFSRIGWALFICWVVVANHFGWAGPISSFMCHPLWQPLGRLSYTAYLVHMFIILYFWNLFDEPLHFATIGEQFLSFTIPVTVMAYVFAFFWSCFCELPFLKLEKMLVESVMRLGRKKPTTVIKEEQREEENWNGEDSELGEKKTGVEQEGIKL